MDVKVVSIVFLVFSIWCVTFVVSAPACGKDNCDELDCGFNPKGKYKDENNCPKCKCLSDAITVCPAFKCYLNCTYGFRLDEKQCPRCECCPSINCSNEVKARCGNNLKKDDTGCPYCACP